MRLRHYTVVVTPDGDPPHEFGVKATSALAALAQIVDDEINHGTSGPVVMLDEGRLRELRGFQLGRAK